MSKRNYYGDLTAELYTHKVPPLVFPVALDIPEAVAETMPRRELRLIRGTFHFRFYPHLPPQIGDTITRNGHQWKITGREHPDLQVRCSPKNDHIPIIHTQYLGKISNDN
jgi:hypothetical protein